MSGRNIERDEAVMKLRGRGHSLRMISAELSLSRGCVSGIICRARKAGDPRGEKHIATVAVTRKAPTSIARTKPRLVVAPTPPPKPAEIFMPQGHNRVLFLDVRLVGQCRFPLWGDNTPFPEKFYCGNPADDSQVYCPTCRKIAYGPGTPSEQSAIRDARKAA